MGALKMCLKGPSPGQWVVRRGQHRSALLLSLRLESVFPYSFILFYQRPDQYDAHDQMEGRGIQPGEIASNDYGKDEVCYGIG